MENRPLTHCATLRKICYLILSLINRRISSTSMYTLYTVHLYIIHSHALQWIKWFISKDMLKYLSDGLWMVNGLLFGQTQKVKYYFELVIEQSQPECAFFRWNFMNPIFFEPQTPPRCLWMVKMDRTCLFAKVNFAQSFVFCILVYYFAFRDTKHLCWHNQIQCSQLSAQCCTLKGLLELRFGIGWSSFPIRVFFSGISLDASVAKMFVFIRRWQTFSIALGWQRHWNSGGTYFIHCVHIRTHTHT